MGVPFTPPVAAGARLAWQVMRFGKPRCEDPRCEVWQQGTALVTRHCCGMTESLWIVAALMVVILTPIRIEVSRLRSHHPADSALGVNALAVSCATEASGLLSGFSHGVFSATSGKGITPKSLLSSCVQQLCLQGVLHPGGCCRY